VAYAGLKAAWPRHRWKVAHKEAVSRKPHRIMPGHRHHAPPPILKPIRPINRMTAEMWKDYRIFKAAGLLSEWRKKWAAYLPEPD
jgi:hypothetical protein